MTNVSATTEKSELRDRLWEIGLETLRSKGFDIERVSGSGKSSMRRITKNGVSKIATIRTTQDRWFAFPRTKDDKGWLTLDDSDCVVVVSVNEKEAPKFAWVHMFDQADIKKRLNRAYEVRRKAKRHIPVGRGVWISLYRKDDGSPQLAGAGAGNDSPRIAEVLLQTGEPQAAPISAEALRDSGGSVRPLSINEAKQGLALTFGVDPSHIKITVEA
jgi:hypothetical protein